MSLSQQRTASAESAQPATPEDQFARALERAWETDEFRDYQSNREALKDAAKAGKASVESAFAAHERRREREDNLITRAGSRRGIQAVVVLAVIMGLQLAAFVLVGLVPPLRDGFYGSFGLGDLILPGLALVLLVASATSAVRMRRLVESRATAALTEARYKWSVHLDSIARETLRLVVNGSQSGPANLAFPQVAPDLIEIQHESFVETPAITYVKRFVSEHSTSAIGVAGARGAGKSTLMRSVAELPDTLYVEIPAAGSYSPTELLRRIAFTLAAPDGRGLGRGVVLSGYRAAVIATFLAPLLTTVGAVLVYLDLKDPSWAKPMSGVTVVGVAAVFAGFLIGVLRPRVRRRPYVPSDSPTAALALDLTYERSDEVSATASLDVTGFLGLEQSATRGRTSRELTYGDLVQRLRTVLRHEAQYRRVVVAIDELDKIADVKTLANTVNAIKDLFRIRGVHFLVSVSDEALRSFQSRGLRERDAFDSSFDIVKRVDRMPIEQGRLLLNSRVAGFPDELAVLCTVWTGGLARDTIRLARECIDIQRDEGPMVTWNELALALLEQNVRTRDEAAEPGAFNLELDLDLADMLQSELDGHLVKGVLQREEVSPLTAFTLLAKRALEVVADAEAAALHPGESHYKLLQELSRRIATLSGPAKDLSALSLEHVEYVGQTVVSRAGLTG